MTLPFDAFHLPAAAAARVEGGAFRDLEAGSVTCRYPAPDPEQVEALAGELRATGAELQNRSVAGIIESIDAAAGRLADSRDALRAEAETLLPAATGYSPAMIRLILDRMTADWRADTLRRLVESELGDSRILDHFVPRSATRASHAVGPRLAFHVFSGNVPGVAVTSLIRTLLVRAPSIAKLASGEPVLPVLFARALRSIDPALANALAITYWPGGETAPEDAALAAADTVIIYGGDNAVRSIRDRTEPGRRIVIHGPRASLGMIGSGELEGGLEGTARRAARAVATFDQQGCVSPHALWVEGPPERAAAFAQSLARALDEIETDLPRATLSPAEASAIHQERGAAELRGHADPRVQVWAGKGTSWTVVLEPATTLRASCLNRFIRVHPIDDLGRLPSLLSPLQDQLQSVALEGTDARHHSLALSLARAGATRISTLERLPWPAPDTHHDGAPPLRELLRWVDRET